MNPNKNPLLFEINTRVWLKKFGPNTKLDQVPEDFWKELRNRGFHYVWLMGVWQTSKNSIEKYCFEEGLKKEYTNALPGWQKKDVIGSPYSIEDYIVNPELGGEESLLALKEKLNSVGLKLILDFVANHFSAESGLIESNPEIFLHGSHDLLQTDPKTFFEKSGKIFAHGKDPYFDAWGDTLQINYFSQDARNFMLGRLEKVAKLCDGVRCDMAMLINNSVFQKTWAVPLSQQNIEQPNSESWSDAISKIRKHKEFVFIAEVYWDREWDLQQLGFDYTYDKKLLDRLKTDDVNEIKTHLWADDNFQKRSLRFLENHDEERSAKIFGEQKLKAAATILLTLQGMRLVNEGQCDGKLVKLPVQLGREPKESSNREIRLYYDKLYEITNKEIFREGRWEPIEPDPAWEGNNTNGNLLTWLWSYGDERLLVIVNYSNEPSQCSLKFDTKNFEEDIELNDVLNDVKYTRSVKEINNIGLYVELQPYKSHIFTY